MKFFKRFMVFVLAAALCLSPAPAKVYAESGVAILQESGYASADQETKQYSFYVEKHLDNAHFEVKVGKVCNAILRIYQDGKEVGGALSTTRDDNWIEYFGYGGGSYYWDFALNPGYNAVTVTLDEDTDFELYVGYFSDVEGEYGGESDYDYDYDYDYDEPPAKPSPSISAKKATITAGFSKTLKVSNGKVKSWKSSNTSVATVKGGKVTGKKAGKATITATLKSGKKLTCKVTVKANKYTEKKLTFAVVEHDHRLCARPYSITYDKSGNLVVKVHAVNNNYTRVTELRDINLVMQDANGKYICRFYLSKKALSIDGYKDKDFSITIPKSKLDKKNANLRKAKILEWNFMYVYKY